MDIIIGTSAWLLTALCCYLFLRGCIYNLLDPLFQSIVSIAFSAALLAVLCNEGLIPWDKLALFSAILTAYLIGAHTSAKFFGRETFRQAISDTVSNIRRGEIIVVLAAATGITLVLAILGMRYGAGGDARQGFDRALRPLLLVQSGLSLFSLVLMLSPRFSVAKALVWLAPLVLLSIPFSGKGIALPLVAWAGLKLYLQRQSISFWLGTGMIVLVLAGGGIMALLSYGTGSPLEAFLLLTNRMWMAGDVYIYAYQSNGLQAVRGDYPVSFLAYMMHPITALVGIRGYDKPLGAMLVSELLHDDLLTGPNPQLPVLLDYFFPNRLIASAPIAFMIGLVVIGIRSLGMVIASTTRSRYLRLGAIVAAVFAPSAGFLDTSLVIIALVGIVAVTTLFIGAEMLLARPQTPAHSTKGQATTPILRQSN